MEKPQFQGFEEEYPSDNNNNNNNNDLLQPVIPGTNLPIQTDAPAANSTEDVTVAREPEIEPGNIPWSTTFMEETAVVESTAPIGPLMTGLQEDPDSVPEKIPPSNYQTKVPDPTGEGGKEVEVEPLLERLDEFHIRDDQSSPTVDQVTMKKSVSASTEYPRKAAEVLAPVYRKVAVALSNKGASAREYLGEKLRPGEDDKALSEAICGRFRKKEEVVVGERSSGVMDRLKGAFKSTTGLGTLPGLGAEHLDKEEPPQTTTTVVVGDVTSG